MNFQDLIQVVDFSALFQLAFTLYAAFIAVEYAKSFTYVVINRFYNFKGEIKNSSSIILKACREEEMQSIDSDDYFKTGDGLCLVDEYKASIKKCKDKANSIETSLSKYVDTNTKYNIFRHISLYMLLYSFTFLLAGGVYSVFPTYIIRFLLAFTAISGLFIIVTWFCAATRATLSWPDKRSLIWVVIIYFGSVIVSCISLRLHPSWCQSIKSIIWNGGIVIAAVLPYLNFVFFFLLVTIQIRKMRVFISSEYTSLSVDTAQTGALMSKLLNHQEMIKKIDEHKKSEQSVNKE